MIGHWGSLDIFGNSITTMKIASEVSQSLVIAVYQRMFPI